MSRALGIFVVGCTLFAGVPAAAQTPPGKLELTIIPAAWVSFVEPDTAPEPSFSQYAFGALIAFNPGPVSIEGELVWALPRKQTLDYGTTSVEDKSPPVFLDSVSLIVPFMRGARAIQPFVAAGIGETTINRTREVGQVDTETFLTGTFGGGVKWYSTGRWGFRADYKYAIIRSEDHAPGSFFGSELRQSHRIYAGLLLNLIPR